MTTAASLRVFGLSRGLLLGLLGSTAALTVQARDVTLANEQRSISVSYAGLDLADPAAMHSLYGRLKVAARIVCGGDISGVREVQRIYAHRACTDSALEAAVSNVGSTALTALHRSEREAPLI